MSVRPVAAAGPFTAVLWETITPVYQQILAHPFLAGLSSGDLGREEFAGYVVQDAHYLSSYARALALLGARAPDRAATAMFATHAAGAVAVEEELHAGLLRDLGLTDRVASEPAGPTTAAYTSYLLATAHGGSFAEGLFAVLPCYWIYWEVGKDLVLRSSPDPLYARWIDTYAGEEFAGIVAAVLELAERVGPALPPAEHAAVARHFLTAARYEWMFWDAAWRREIWPV